MTTETEQTQAERDQTAEAQDGKSELAPSAASEVESEGGPLRCSVFRNGRRASTPANLSDLSEILQENRTFVWLDVIDPQSGDLTLLQQEFKLHPLAVDDAVQAHQRPKIVTYGEGGEAYWFIVVQPATMAADKLTIYEMAVFAGKKFLVTVRHDPAFPLDEIERRWLAHTEDMHCDSGFLLYTVLDTVVDGYFPVAEWFEERVDSLEEALFADRARHDDFLLQIFALKKEGQRFRRAALPMRDVLAPIVRGDLSLFPEEQKAYFRDVYDHAVRVIDQVDATRDLNNSALDIQLSVTANRQNEVSKQLTIIATIFLPLTFITGFFGQNFGVLISHITGAGAFWWLGIGSEVVVLVLLVAFFKRRGWF